MLVKETTRAIHPNSRALQQHLFCLLQNCKALQTLAQIHAQIITNGFAQKNFILVKLLSFHVASGHLEQASQIFGRVERPSSTVWNQIIKGHAWSGKPQESVQLYRQMGVADAVPDGYTYSYVFKACCRAGLFREGEQIHGRVLSKGFGMNVFVQTNLVNFYVNIGGEVGVRNARQVFGEMTDRNVVTWNTLLVGCFSRRDFDGAMMLFNEIPERNAVSWTTMISGCAQNGRSKQALSLFREMMRAHVEFDQVTLVAALSACAKLGDLKLGKCIHLYVKDNFLVSNQPILVSLNNALIHMYANCGEIEVAYDVFKGMSYRNTVSWTSMITGFAKQGCGQEALGLFQWMLSMEQNDARPDERTFLGVLCACSHTGFVDHGCYLFHNMKNNWGIEPMIEHYGCIVDLLSRAGFLNEAHRIIETMPMKPSDAVWGAILGGCRIHGNVQLATEVCQKLVVPELDADRATGYLVLLSNLYATAKRWQDVSSMRKLMIEMGIKKPPGQSSIQVGRVSHHFLAGDHTHDNAYLIYEMLGKITRQARLEGYKPGVSGFEEQDIQIEENGLC